MTLALPWPDAGAGGVRAERVQRTVAAKRDEIELVSAIARGDRDAFRAFYDAYAGRILAYVRALGRERNAAEDVVQEVFLAVWRKAASYRPDRGDVAGWLYTITRNRLVDRWRRTGGALEEGDFDFDALPVRERGAEGKIVDLSVRKALAGLAPEQREALELAYFGGLTYEETAARLALPVGTLKSRIRAGLARMRAFLSEGPTLGGEETS